MSEATSDGEAQAGAALAPLHTLETLEDALLVGGIDPRTLVADMRPSASVGPVEAQGDGGTPRRMTHCISDEVHEDLDNATRIAASRHWRAWLKDDLYAARVRGC